MYFYLLHRTKIHWIHWNQHANAYLFPLLPLVAIAGLSTAGMVLFLFLVFLVGLANTSSLFVLGIPAVGPANNGGLLSFSPSESSPSSSCPPSLSSEVFSPSLPL
jgi:hypothetical protein